MSKVSKGLEKAGVIGASTTLLGGAGSALLLALAASPAAASATWTVDTLDDGAATASDCTTPVVGSCSLRDALAAAASGDTIMFSPALFSGGAGTITLTDGQLVNNGVNVLGPGANLLSINAAAASRIFELTPAPAGTTVSGVTLTNGLMTGTDVGGAILVQGSNTLTVSGSVLTGNVGGSAGGAVYAASLVLTDSTVSNNISQYFGGGIVASAQLSISNSTISGNSAKVLGGGITLFGTSANFSLIDSTMSGNTAQGGGAIGGYSVSGSVTIANSTLTGNSAIGGGGAIALSASRLDISMSTITGNSAGAASPFYSGGGVMISSEGLPLVTLTGTVIAGNTAGAGGTSDLIVGASEIDTGTVTANNSLIGSGVSTNVSLIGTGLLRSDTPMLGALANNGGPTLTMLPLVGSPLIDAGPATIPVFAGNQFDQRGPGFPRVLGSMSDIGAVETPASEPVVPAFTG